jgi:hypothetical protein
MDYIEGGRLVSVGSKATQVHDDLRASNKTKIGNF